jgi:hypothetical protein
LLDWGDSGVGHPLLDLAAFLDPTPNGAIETVLAYWSEAVPGSDAARAAALLTPRCRAAGGISVLSEQPYHRADPAKWLSAWAALVREGDGRDAVDA